MAAVERSTGERPERQQRINAARGCFFSVCLPDLSENGKDLMNMGRKLQYRPCVSTARGMVSILF
jgi:hypothetical protein